MLKMLSTVCSCLKITLYLIWDHLSLLKFVPECSPLYITHKHTHTSKRLFLSPSLPLFLVAWKSYCLYLLIYLVHFPILPYIFIGLFFLHPDQNIKLPASHKPNTYRANSEQNVQAKKRKKKSDENKKKKEVENSLLIWCCYWHQSKVYTLYGALLSSVWCLCVWYIFVIRFNTFLMHFKTMATKITHTKNNISSIQASLLAWYTHWIQCFDSSSFPLVFLHFHLHLLHIDS